MQQTVDWFAPLAVGKANPGGYVFITWEGDHPPRHVHGYRDGDLVVKWDLDNQKAMKGAAAFWN